MNNPTLGDFCVTTVGRADIEGSKSNVATNAWLPRASYPCGNFSDTSCFKLGISKSKGSIGHAFTVCTRTENQNQISFCPFTLRQVSVLAELILGHLRYHLTDVPPQSNSPPDIFSRTGRALLKANPKSETRSNTKNNQDTNTRSRTTHAGMHFVPKINPVSLGKPRDDDGGGISLTLAETSSHLFYTRHASSQSRTRVKLNRVFFPRRFCQARSLGCGFARW